MMATVSYPAGGWLAPGTPINWQRNDQGKDFVIPWQHVLQAPGSGVCIANGSDRPFPNGFGPSYAMVEIHTGRFAGHSWYIGHCTSLVSPGEQFVFGHPLARADQGHDFEGTTGGWVELGERQPDGSLGPNSPSGHWYNNALQTPLVVKIPDPVLKYGDKGWDVLKFTTWLTRDKYLPRPYFVFNRPVHGAVVQFQKDHQIKVDGQVDGQTWNAIKFAKPRKKLLGLL